MITPALVFVALLVLALLGALAALFISIQNAGEKTPVLIADESALADERNAVLRALRDLRYEHEVGKIEDEDFQRLEKAYRNRAKELVRALDRNDAEYRKEAERLLAEIGVKGAASGAEEKP